MKIIPAILAETLKDFHLRIRQAERFADYVQIDLMDALFVPSRSFPAEHLNTLRTSLFMELHLMVKDPWAFIRPIHHPNIKSVIFHFESDVDHARFITFVKGRGTAVGLAVKPENALSEFRVIAEQVDTLLFLAVDPGAYGSPFKVEVLEKIKAAKRLFPGKPISVDGGVSLDNLKSFMRIGIDSVCVGSRIFLKGNPDENYRQFIGTLDALEDH